MEQLYGQGADGPKARSVYSIPRDVVESSPQNVESLEELKSHPTISQDWTDQATVDNNRLVAIQEKKLVAQGKKSGGEAYPRGPSSPDYSEVETEPKPSHSSAQAAYARTQPMFYKSRHKGHSGDGSLRSHRNRRRNPLGNSTQDRGPYLDHSSFVEEEDDSESLNSEGHCTVVSNDIRHLEKLKKENAYLKSRLREPLPRLQVIYRISRVRHNSKGDETVTDMYLDKPQLLEGDKGVASLQGHLPISRLDSYLERHPKISVIVFQDTYNRKLEIEAGDEALEISWSESIFVTSRQLMKTLKLLERRLSLSLGYRISLDLTGSTATFPAPYLAFYHYLGKLREYAADLPPKAIQEWRLLVKYIEHSYGDQYGEVDNMLAAGTITQEFIPYLIKDGDTIVRRDSRGHSAYVATSQPTARVKRRNNGSGQNRGVSYGRQMDVEFRVHSDSLDGTGEGLSDSSVQTLEWEIETESWLFDGNFEKRSGTTILKISSPRDEMLSIKDLEVYPIQYADPDLELNMKNAGLELWKSRSRRYVSYRSGRAEIDTKSSKPRYMIDPATYKKLHPQNSSEKALRDDLGPELMSAEEPPADPFLLLLPRTINGFNMQNKKWEELEVADSLSSTSSFSIGLPAFSHLSSSNLPLPPHQTNQLQKPNFHHPSSPSHPLTRTSPLTLLTTNPRPQIHKTSSRSSIMSSSASRL